MSQQQCIHIRIKQDEGVAQCSFGRNRTEATRSVEHQLAEGERYLISPAHHMKAAEYRGRLCVFIRGRFCRGNTAKAIVRFLDDGSERRVDPGDMLPCPLSDSKTVEIETEYGIRYFAIEAPILPTGRAVAIHCETNCTGTALTPLQVLCAERSHLFDHVTPDAEPVLLRTPQWFDSQKTALAEAKEHITRLYGLENM